MSGMNPYGLGGDESNPYAPPRAELRGEAYPMKTPGARVEPFSIESVMKRAWSLYKEQMGLVIGLVIGSGAVSWVLSLATNLLPTILLGPNADPNSLNLLTFGLLIPNFLVSLWISAGVSVAMIKVARRQPASFGDVVGGGRYILSFLWGSIVLGAVCGGAYFVIAFVTIMAGVVLGQGDPKVVFTVFAVGIGGGVLSAMLLAVRMYFFQFAIIDQNIGGYAAIKTSYRITQGHFFELIILALAAIAISLAGFIACIVGLIFTGPFCVLLPACAYVSLADEEWARQNLSEEILLQGDDFLTD